VKRFEGKVALVTGAARGIGRGIVLRLAGEGADVVVNDFTNMDDARVVADEITQMGRRVLVWQADVSDREAVAEMFAGAAEHFGHIEIVIANAAYSVREPVLEAKWEDFLRTIEVTQFGVVHTCQMAARQMVKQSNGGKIIITGSLLQEIPFPTSAAYNMSKAAVNHFARTLAAELTSHHINVNTINPGWINTPGERKFYSEAEIQEAGKAIPWGRIGTPADIAAAAAFLASDDADYITGTSLTVDGGYKLGMRLPERGN
jgi:glucose 1-dehydrogenase